MAGFKRKHVACPTCKRVTEHRQSVDQPGSIRWAVTSCVVCGSQWRVPVDQPAHFNAETEAAVEKEKNSDYEAYDYE